MDAKLPEVNPKSSIRTKVAIHREVELIFGSIFGLTFQPAKYIYFLNMVESSALCLKFN